MMKEANAGVDEEEKEKEKEEEEKEKQKEEEKGRRRRRGRRRRTIKTMGRRYMHVQCSPPHPFPLRMIYSTCSFGIPKTKSCDP